MNLNSEEININEPSKIHSSARNYLQLGFSIIPVGKNKTPLIGWKKYQTEKPTTEQIEEWFSKPRVNIGLITGQISGVGVVDIDIDKLTGKFSPEAEELMQKLPPTLISITGGGGRHYFYRLTKPLKSYNGIMKGVDIKADGGYVILPPSVHESGREYQYE